MLVGLWVGILDLVFEVVLGKIEEVICRKSKEMLIGCRGRVWGVGLEQRNEGVRIGGFFRGVWSIVGIGGVVVVIV